MTNVNMTTNMKIRTGTLLVLALLILAALPSFARANPQGGTVARGSVKILQESPAKLTVIQSTDKAVVNWQSFSIGAGEHTRFQQPSSSSIILNRVVGGDPSSILGQLTANGRVVLVNPNGIFFGKDAKIDVAALIASTHDIKNDDFMAGRLKFTLPGKPGARIVNQGIITVEDGGLAALVAPSVANSGVIAARLGKVVLASGNTATIDLYGDNLILFDAGSAITEHVHDATGTPLSSLIDQSGRIEADGGWVLLTAAVSKGIVDKAVNMTGIIQARTAGLQSGRIVLKGSEGDIVLSGALDASAPEGGDGGFIETSANHVAIQPSAHITTSSQSGKTGLWLLDPTDYTISASGGDITGALLGGYLGSSNITVQTSAFGVGNGDIFVNNGVSWSSGNVLTLSAHRNINVDAALTATGGGSLVLRSDYDANGTGTVTFGGTGHVTLAGGGIAELYYNPAGGYASPTNYAPFFTGTTPIAYMLVNSMQNLQSMNTNMDGFYALGKDLDASATSTWNSGAGFIPIGNTNTPFTGILNGDGHTITNLTINRPSTDEIGLFGSIEDRGEPYTRPMILNLGLVNPSITGHENVGGLVGWNSFGIISNSYVSGGTVLGYADAVGGLAGQNWGGEIYGSYSSAAVSAIGINAGGLVGDNNTFSIIDRCYSTGSVQGLGQVGGLVGYDFIGCEISNSYSTAAVSGGSNVGGLIGVFWGTNGDDVGTITNCYSTGPVTGNSQAGGLIGLYWSGDIVSSYWDTTTSGQATSGTSQVSLGAYNGTGLTTSQMKSQGSFSGWDFTGTWEIEPGAYPTLRAAASTTPDVPDDPGDPDQPIPPTPYPSYIPIWGIPLSWSLGTPHYASWEDYLKTNPFVMTVSMNKSIQLDSQGRFIDGMLNPLGYLSPFGISGLGFAGLDYGGTYKGYSETGSSWEVRQEWAAEALRRSIESSKQGSTYDPVVAKMWQDAALARLRTSRQGAGDAGSGDRMLTSGQGGSGDNGQGSLVEGSDSESFDRRRSQAIENLIDQGLLNPDYVTKDDKGNLSVMNAESIELQRRQRGDDQEGIDPAWIEKFNQDLEYYNKEHEKDRGKGIENPPYTLEIWENFVKFKREQLAERGVESKQEEMLLAQDLSIAKMIDNGTLNPDYVVRSMGHLSIMNEESTGIVDGIKSGTLNVRYCEKDAFGNWLPLTPELTRLQEKWRESQNISKQITDGSLSREQVGMDRDGYYVMLNEKSLSLQQGIEDGSIPGTFVTTGPDGQLMNMFEKTQSKQNLLADQMQGMNSGDKVGKIIQMTNNDKIALSEYDDTKQVLGSLNSSDLANLITYTSTKEQKYLAGKLVRDVETSKLTEAAEDLSPQELGRFIEQGYEFFGDLKAFVGSLSQDQLQELGPYVSVTTMSYLVQYGDPNVVNEIGKGLPEGWREVTEMYHSQAYYIMDLGEGSNRIPYGALYSEIPYFHQSLQVRDLK